MYERDRFYIFSIIKCGDESVSELMVCYKNCEIII